MKIKLFNSSQVRRRIDGLADDQYGELLSFGAGMNPADYFEEGQLVMGKQVKAVAPKAMNNVVDSETQSLMLEDMAEVFYTKTYLLQNGDWQPEAVSRRYCHRC